jgi:hypothetical protein
MEKMAQLTVVHYLSLIITQCLGSLLYYSMETMAQLTVVPYLSLIFTKCLGSLLYYSMETMAQLTVGSYQQPPNNYSGRILKNNRQRYSGKCNITYFHQQNFP